MSDQESGSSADLIEGILQGKVPRQVRLFAAQGLLPVSREDLLSIQTLLSSDPDEELAQVARESIGNEEEKTILDWIRGRPPDPLVLDQLVRVREDESIWAAVARHANTSDETLRVLARHATALVQDIIITNQVRILGCLDILEDLTSEPAGQPGRSASRARVRRGVHRQGPGRGGALAAAGPSVEEAIEALGGDRRPYSEAGDHAVSGVAGRGARRCGQKSRIMTPTPRAALKMSVHEKDYLCSTGIQGGARDSRQQSQPADPALGAVASPKLTKTRSSGSRHHGASPKRSSGRSRTTAAGCGTIRWSSRSRSTPKRPSTRPEPILMRLNHRDKVRVSRDRNVNPVTRQMAAKTGHSAPLAQLWPALLALPIVAWALWTW